MRHRHVAVLWGFVALLAAAGCAEDGSSGGAGAPSPPGRAGPETFRATAITEDGQPRELVAGSEIRLTFDGDAITASGGCNELTGPAAITDDGRLVVPELVTTDVFCGEELARQERWLASFLRDEPAWQRDSDQLVLRTGAAELWLSAA